MRGLCFARCLCRGVVDAGSSCAAAAVAGVVYAAMGQQQQLPEYLKIAQQCFQLVGSSATECVTLPGKLPSSFRRFLCGVAHCLSETCSNQAVFEHRPIVVHSVVGYDGSHEQAQPCSAAAAHQMLPFRVADVHYSL